MFINQLKWRGIPIWPPIWSEENLTVLQHGLLKNVEILPLNKLIKIDATWAGISISGIMLASEEYENSLFRKLKENIGTPLVEVGNLKIDLSDHPDSSTAGRNRGPYRGFVL